MTESRAKKILTETYGSVPKPTVGEQQRHELLILSGKFNEIQLKTDIIHLARSASLTGDLEMAKTALDKWNSLYPHNQYSNLDLFLGVEDE